MRTRLALVAPAIATTLSLGCSSGSNWDGAVAGGGKTDPMASAPDRSGLSVGSGQAASELDNTGQCTVAYAMGNAVDDHRPIIWRNYDWNNPPHWSQMLHHETNQYLNAWGPLYWIGTSQEEWYVFGGVNEKGVGCFNTLLIDFSNEGHYDYGNYRIQGWILGNATSVADVRKAIDEQIKYWNSQPGGVNHDWYYPSGNGGYYPAMSLVVIDALGNTSLFEIGKTAYYEYDPQNANRLAQFPVQVGVRANKPHRRTDHQDNTGTDWATTGGRRYLEARDNVTNQATNGNGLQLNELMEVVSRNGVPGFEPHAYGSLPLDEYGEYQSSNWKNQDGSIIWAAAPGEDARTATLFVAMGLPAYSCYLPVWAANWKSIPNRLLTLDSSSIVYQVHAIFDHRGADTDYDKYVHSLFANMEANNREAASLVRTYWNEFGFNAAMGDKITQETAENVYLAAKSMAGGSGRTLNQPTTIKALGVTWNGRDATFNADATDDGKIGSYAWDFGDGKTGTGATVSHTYGQPDKYLVSCRVTDDKSIRNTRWTLIEVGRADTGVEPDAGADGGGGASQDGGPGSGGAPGSGGSTGGAAGTNGGAGTGGQRVPPGGIAGSPESDSGCGCAVPGSSSGGHALLTALLGLMAGAALRRRRSR